MSVDAGHLFLGIDALQHPRTAIPFTAYGVPNIDPASWVADVGIASVWTTVHEETGTPHPDAPRRLPRADFEAYWAMSAPGEDILGDVDTFGMQEQWTRAPHTRVSELLREHYLGVDGHAPGVSRRWQSFCRANGFRYRDDGGRVTWDPSVRPFWVNRVNRFSDVYGAGRAGSAWGSTVGPAHRLWPYTGRALDHFMDYVRNQLERELAAEQD